MLEESSQALLVLNCICPIFAISDSGIGAGIDSYYEYCLKAYILLGDSSYLEKFNKVSVIFDLVIHYYEHLLE